MIPQATTTHAAQPLRQDYEVDRNTRFVGIVNSRGEVSEGGFQRGVEPLANKTEEQQMYIQSLWNFTTLES